MSGDLLLHGAGTILTGELARPRIDGDAVLIREGRIAAVGTLDDVRTDDAVTMVDVGGATIGPGLIDPHTHPVLGDYTPRQSTSGWITSYLNGGVTTLISAGEPHWPGRPRTAAGREGDRDRRPPERPQPAAGRRQAVRRCAAARRRA